MVFPNFLIMVNKHKYSWNSKEAQSLHLHAVSPAIPSDSRMGSEATQIRSIKGPRKKEGEDGRKGEMKVLSFLTWV